MKYAILILMSISLSASAQYNFRVSFTDTTIVLWDSARQVKQAYAFNTVNVSKSSTSVSLLPNSGVTPINKWEVNSSLIYLTASNNVDSGFNKLLSGFKSASSSGGGSATPAAFLDSNAVLVLHQDTIGKGQAKTYYAYSFGLAFIDGVGSTDITLGGSTQTYTVLQGQLPYSPAHRQPIVINNIALTSGRIRILYK